MKLLFPLFFFSSFLLCSSLYSMSKSVEAIVSNTEKLPSHKLLSAVHGLPDDLSASDCESLCDYLCVALPEGTDEGLYATLKNDVADKLFSQLTFPERLDDALLMAFEGRESQGELWSEYALQKLSEVCKRVSTTAERTALLERLWLESANSDYIYSGTALLGLAKLCHDDPEMVPAEKVAEQALAVTEGNGFAYQNKITSLQVYAQVGDKKKALSIARKFLSDSKTPIQLRTSAIATVGMLGNEADKALLMKYRESGDFRLRAAAKSSLLKLEPRL